MRVLGFSDEITTCDCCGKKNLAGTFGVETDAGDMLRYGSVCVNKVYGKKRGDGIKFAGKMIAQVRSLAWDVAVRKAAFGHFSMVSPLISGKVADMNVRTNWEKVDAFATWNGKSWDVIRERAA